MQVAVECVALAGRKRGVACEQPLGVQPVLFHAGEGVDKGVVVDGHGEDGACKAKAAEFGVEGVGGMDGACFFGKRELAPQFVEGVGVGGKGGEGFAGLFAMVEVVEPFGCGNATAHERVVAVAGPAEGDDVVVARHVVAGGIGEGAACRLVDIDEGSDGEGGVVVVEREVLRRQVEGFGEVAVVVVAANGNGDHLQVVLHIGGEPVAHPVLQDGAFDKFPFDVEEVAHGAVGMGGLPGALAGEQGDVREVEKAVVLRFETVYLGVGVRVDEGDAGADGFAVAAEVGEVAQLRCRRGHGIAHGCHADDDEVYVSLAVGGDEAAVEGEVPGAVGVADKGLQGDGVVLVEEGGLEACVRLLGERLEDVG